MNPLSGRYVAVSTGPLTNAGDFFNDAACVFLGILADGSETDPPSTSQTFETMEGEVGTRATLAHVYRISRTIKGDGDALRTVRNTPGVICSVISMGAGSYTDYGPGIISGVEESGNTMGSEPALIRITFGGTEDFPEDLLTVVSSAATVATA